MARNICFLYPETPQLGRFSNTRKEVPPMGVLLLASYLKLHGNNVIIQKVSENNYIFNLNNFDIIGFSLSASAAFPLMAKARKHSSFNKDSWLIAGGIHASLFPSQSMEQLELDFVCLGEGEVTMRTLTNSYPHKPNWPIANVLRPEENLLATLNKGRGLCQDSDEYALPARELMPMEDIIIQGRLAESPVKMVHSLYSRGCDGSCRFCANTPKKVKYVSGRYLEQDIQNILKLGISSIGIIDDNFLRNQDESYELISILGHYNINWTCLSRVDCINDEILRHASKNGCLEVKFGIESFSQDILNKMRKNIKIDQIYRVLKGTKKFGIKTKVWLIHGFPGESTESTNETIQHVKNLRNLIDRITLIKFVPIPGSYVFNNYKKYQITLPKYPNGDYEWEAFHLYNNETKWFEDQYQKTLDHEFNKLQTYIGNEYKSIFDHQLALTITHS